MANPLKSNSEAVVATISALSHDGRGITHINGKTVFIENALPGETVSFRYQKRRGKFDEGRAETVLEAAPERALPRCQHYLICGGCSMQHINSTTQLQLKQKLLLEQLQHFGKVHAENILPPLTGPLWGYRRKARLGVKYVQKKNAVLVGFREKNQRYLADLERCEVLHPSVGNLIQPLKLLIANLKAYQHIPQIEVAIGDTATALIFRHMLPLEDSDLDKLIAFAQTHTLQLYLQPGGPQSVHLLWPTAEEATLRYRLAVNSSVSSVATDDNHAAAAQPAAADTCSTELTFHFQPSDFTQVNADINQQMVARALELLAPKASDRILDLFCGLGNFTLPIARLCATAVGVEGSEALIQRASQNATLNNITNAQFYQADLTSDFVQLPWCHDFDKILLDPPRTGALEIVQKISLLGAKRIVYVSCNPATLARDAGELIRQGYRLSQTGIMDMFPHTHHVEAIALFEL